MRIPVTKPYFGQEELEALREPLMTGWVTQGPKVKEFEEAVSLYTAASHARATTSCTTALHLALLACGVGPGDEVIVPSFTFVASANAVEYVGAKPVFVDIDLDTFNVDASQIAKAVTRRTKALMPVHLFGLCADMDPVMQIARKHQLRVIEDAACAIGAYYNGRHAGTFGDAGCFSFHPRKSITTGEGGMVVTNDPEIAQKVEILRNHGAEVSDLARHEGKGLLLPQYSRLGFNYRMSDLLAAVGKVQLGRLDWLVSERRRRAQRYTEALSGVQGIKLPLEPAGYFHVYQSYVVLLMDDGRLSRDALAERLAGEGIATRQGTHAVHTLGFYASKYTHRPQDFPNALTADRQSLTLPLYPQMTDDDQEYVVDRVRTITMGQ